MKHFDTIKRLTVVAVILLACVFSATASDTAPFLTLDSGAKIMLNNTLDYTCDNAVEGGTISGVEKGCADPTYDPPIISNVSLPTGGSGTLEYIWISTTDDLSTANPTWSPISGSTSSSYDPGPISTGTSYRRCARRSGCIDYIAESNIITIVLDCCDNVTDGGTIEKDQSICGTSIDVAPITNVTLPSGGSGDLEYLWLQTTSCSDYFDGNTDWTIVPNSNSASLDPGVITETTCYIRCVRRKGCTDYIGESNVVTVTINPVPSASIAINSDPKCDQSGKLTASGSGGVAPYSYAWSNGASTSMISNLGGGTYTVVITDANGCTASANENLTAAQAPTATVVTTDVSCSDTTDGMATVTVSGGTAPYTYSFSSGTASGNKATNLGAGSHSVVITDANGCKVTLSFSIAKPSPVFVNLIKNADPKCDNSGKVTASASGGTAPYSYKWSNGATTPMISGLSAGTYTVTATDDRGCTNVQSITLVAAGAPTVSMTSVNIACNGDANGSATATASGGDGSYNYAWSNGMSTATISNLTPGTYSVTVTDGNYCTVSGSVTVTEPTAVTLTASGTNETCGDDNGTASATAAGGTPGYTYAWSNGASTASISGLATGTYSVTATDTNGCTASKSVTISNEAGPDASATGSDLYCNGDTNGTASATAAGGTAPFTYAWSNGATTASISGLAAGTYSVVVTDANGCTDNASATVTEPTQINASATGSNATCGEANGSATASASGGTPAYTYAWSDGQSGAIATGLASGSYTVTATDANGCYDTATVSIGNDGGPSVTVTGTNLTCNYNYSGSATASATGGSGTITYLWSNGATTASITGLAAGTYSVTATDANGCQDSESVTITEPSKVTLTVSGTNETCGDDNGTASATAAGGTPGYTYAWSNGASTASISGLAAGTYSVTATDTNGCTASKSVTISNEAGPDASATGSDLYCNGDTNGTAAVTTAGGTAPFTYAWSNGATTASISGLAAGTYSVVVTDANGCTDNASATVTEPTQINASATGSNATCGEANGSATASASGGTPGYTYAWSDGQSGATASDLAAGSYTVTVTDANGCYDTATVSIGNDGGPSVTVTGTNLTCNSNYSGSATASATGGSGTITYLWSNGATTASITGLAAGTYSVTATDANGCQDSESVTITEPSKVTLTVSGTNETCGDDNGTASATAAGGTPGYTYAWSNGGSTASISGLATGTYSVTATDTNGCTASKSVTISNEAGPDASATGSDLYCNGDTNGTASATAAGGTAPFTYAWSNGATTASISGLAAGTYSVVVTDANGCTDNASATVTEPTQINASATGSNATCGEANGSATASASGGTPAYTYAWSDGQSGAIATGLAAGSYTVTATDANGCYDTATVSIGNDGGPSVTVTGTNLTCNYNYSGSATASATGGSGTITYLWSNGATTASITGLAAGTYSVTATDANGCQDSESVTITEPSKVTLTVSGTNETCGDDNGTASATAAGGTPGYTYAWSNGGSTASISGLAAGTYSVTATDTNGCTASKSVTISNEAGPDASATGSDLYCNGDTNGTAAVTTAGGTAPFTYAWSNGATTASISGLAAGTYSVVVTDANGCTDNTSATVTEPTQINASATGSNATCGEANGSANASASGGTPGYTYAWSDGQSGAIATGLASGSYTVTATDANGCYDTATVSIGNDGGPSVTVTGTNLTCNYNYPGSATASATGGSGTITYLWSNGATTASITGLAAGTYSVTATDANGCQDSESVTITEPSKVTLTVSGTNETCGDDNGTASATAAGGTPGYTYAWSNGGSTASISGLAAGTYSVTATDTNGCTASKSVTISNEAGPDASATGSDLYCNGDTNGTAAVTTAGGTAPFTYAWSNGATTASISGLAAGTYSVVVTDANGCTDNTSATVTEPTQINASATGSNATCGEANGSANASASGGTPGYTYAWSDGQSGAIATGLASGSYTVTATDANGCYDTATVSIGNDGGPSVTVTGTNLTCNYNYSGSATASATGGSGTITYLWSNGATTASITGLAAGTYSVTATDANGCQDSESVTITEPSKVTLTVSGTNETCGDDNGTASATAAGGTPGYTYAWSNGASTASISGLATGTYSVTATDTNGCTASKSVTISNEAGPDASATGSDLYCNGDTNGTASATAAGGTAPFTYAWSNGATTASISGLAAGTYSVVVTDANGCTDNASATVTEPTQINASATGSNATCGEANGSATASASGGTPGYTYAWSDGQSGATASDLAVGTYSVTVTDANGCTATASVTIGNIGGPSVTIIGSNLYCNGVSEGSAVANVTGGTAPYTYVWSNGGTESSLWAIAAGTYTVTVTDANGCEDIESVTITEPTKVTLTASGSNETCGDDNGTASATAAGGTPGYTYAWSNGASTASISGLAAGTYSVTATDANGCQASKSVTIINEAGPALVAEGSPLDCHGDSDGTAWASATGGKAPLAYLWSNGATDANIDGLSAGTYGVTVTDANGCTANTFTIVTQPTKLVVEANRTNATCSAANGSASASATGGTPGYAYLWSNGATTATATGLLAGPYTVTVTDANGCTETASVTIGNIGGPSVTISAKTDVSCHDLSDGTATAVASGGTAPYTYAWSSGATTATATGLGFGGYTVTVTDANGCTISTGVTITQPNPMVAATVINTVPGCNDNGSITASGTGGTAPYTYLWNTNATGSTISGLSGGTYIVTVTDSKGCADVVSTPLLDSTPGTISVTTVDIDCNGDDDGKATATLSEGQAPIAWSFSGGTQANNMSSDLAAGTYRVTATDALGCVSTATFTITEPQNLVALMTTESAGCDDTSGKATVNAQGGTAPYTYNWSTGATTTMITDLAPGSYGVTVTDANDCTATGTAIVANDADLVCSSKDVKPATCYGGNDGRATAVATGGQGPYTYAWSNGANQATATNLTAGSYTFTITDNNGCTCIGSVFINQPEELVCSAEVTTELSGYNSNDADAKVTVTGGNGGNTFAWSNGSTGMTASNLSPGMHTVTVTDINGCSCESKVTVINKSQLGDKVFSDINGNGIQDPDEPGVDGIKVILTNLGDMSTTETTTTNGGMYLFDGLDAGSYKVTFELPDGSVFSPSNVGNDAQDSDANEMGMTETIALGQGESNLTVDAGIVRSGINVGDYVWIDTNQNGIQDFNEDGIGGILVTLTNTADNSTRTMLTSGDGSYLFADVTPGKYKITFSNLLEGYTFTTADQGGDDSQDSDANEMGMTPEFMVMLGDPDNLTLDAGIHLICDNVTDAGMIAADQKLCGSNTPETLTSVILPSGGNGEIEYVWLKNETDVMGIPGFGQSGWVVIPNSNKPYYFPGNVTKSTFYVRCARRKGCISFAESNVIRVEICDLPVANAIYEAEDTCLGAPVEFKAENAGAGATYAWSFPGAEPNSADSREVQGIIYSTMGNKTFTLTVTSAEGCVTSNDFNIWIGCDNGLVFGDVSATSSNAKSANSKSVKIDWSLQNQTVDHEYFIEQSTDGNTYQVVGSVKGDEVMDYTFEDTNPKLGTSFYRVKHIDQVGNYVISDEVQIILRDGAIKNMFAYPNPAIDKVQLELFEPLKEDGMLYVLDGNGRIVKTVVVSANTQLIDVDLSKFTRGMYFIEVQYDGFKKYRQKVIKVE